MTSLQEVPDDEPGFGIHVDALFLGQDLVDRVVEARTDVLEDGEELVVGHVLDLAGDEDRLGELEGPADILVLHDGLHRVRQVAVVVGALLERIDQQRPAGRVGYVEIVDRLDEAGLLADERLDALLGALADRGDIPVRDVGLGLCELLLDVVDQEAE